MITKPSEDHSGCWVQPYAFGWLTKISECDPGCKSAGATCILGGTLSDQHCYCKYLGLVHSDNMVLVKQVLTVMSVLLSIIVVLGMSSYNVITVWRRLNEICLGMGRSCRKLRAVVSIQCKVCIMV